MLSLAARSLRSVAPRVAAASSWTARRALSTAKPERKFETKHEGDIPEGRDGLVGTSREEEIYTSKFGQELYDREASAYYEEGTKENPICILSESHERIVGISLTDDNNIRWFTLREGELAYDPDTNNYLALRTISQADIAAALAAAEKKDA